MAEGNLQVFINREFAEHLSTLLELNTPGLRAEASVVREYNTTYAAHILGYIGPVTTQQWNETYKAKEGYALDALVGQSGLEEAFEEYLRGQDGILVIVEDKNGNRVDEYYKKEPVPGKDVYLTIDIDMAVVAVGVSPNPLVPTSVEGLELGRKNTIAVNENMQSSIPFLYAGGDIVRGGATVILAMGDGRRAAAAMHEYLSK